MRIYHETKRHTRIIEFLGQYEIEAYYTYTVYLHDGIFKTPLFDIDYKPSEAKDKQSFKKFLLSYCKRSLERKGIKVNN
jgi:hypothetical protein